MVDLVLKKFATDCFYGQKKPPQKCGGSGWIVETDSASTEWPSVNAHQISMSQKHCVQVRR
jgi:hypothetical protein